MGKYASDILVGRSNIHHYALLSTAWTWFTHRLRNQLSLHIISSLKVLPVYKTSCRCVIMFMDKYLYLYRSIYGILIMKNILIYYYHFVLNMENYIYENQNNDKKYGCVLTSSYLNCIISLRSPIMLSDAAATSPLCKKEFRS